MDRQEFASLYERLRRPLFAYAAARLSPQVALDVVHDTFEVVWSKRSSAPREPDQLVSWCFGIARNKVLQEIQRVQRKHHDNRFIEDTGLPPRESVDDVADVVVRAAVGREVWQSLSPEDRNLLMVVVSTDLAGAEVADLMGLSHDAYRRRVSRLRARIVGRWQLAESKQTVEGGGAR